MTPDLAMRLQCPACSAQFDILKSQLKLRTVCCPFCDGEWPPDSLPGVALWRERWAEFDRQSAAAAKARTDAARAARATELAIRKEANLAERMRRKEDREIELQRHAAQQHRVEMYRAATAPQVIVVQPRDNGSGLLRAVGYFFILAAIPLSLLLCWPGALSLMIGLLFYIAGKRS